MRQKEVQRQRKVQPAIGKWSAANILLPDVYRGTISVYLSLEICYNASMHRHLSSDTFQLVVFFSKHLTAGLDAAATGRL